MLLGLPCVLLLLVLRLLLLPRPPVEDHLEILFYLEGLFPVFAQLVLPGIVLDDTHPFGEQINTSIPLVQAWPEGPDVALETTRRC